MSRGTRFVRLVVAIVAIAMIALPAAAQVTTGTLTGTVKDAQGAVIPGVTVTFQTDSRNSGSSSKTFRVTASES